MGPAAQFRSLVFKGKNPVLMKVVLLQAPPRADVVKGLRSGIMVNILGMGAALLGMQATVGFLVAKALTTSANPFYQGVSQGYSPVLALDVFLVQVLSSTILLCSYYKSYSKNL